MKNLVITFLIVSVFPIFASPKIAVDNADDFVTELSRNVGFNLDAQDDFQFNLEKMCTGENRHSALEVMAGIQAKLQYQDSSNLEGYEVFFFDQNRDVVRMISNSGSLIEANISEVAVMRVRIHRRFDTAVSNVEIVPENLVCEN